MSYNLLLECWTPKVRAFADTGRLIYIYIYIFFFFSVYFTSSLCPICPNHLSLHAAAQFLFIKISRASLCDCHKGCCHSWLRHCSWNPSSLLAARAYSMAVTQVFKWLWWIQVNTSLTERKKRTQKKRMNQEKGGPYREGLKIYIYTREKAAIRLKKIGQGNIWHLRETQQRQTDKSGKVPKKRKTSHETSKCRMEISFPKMVSGV